MTAVSLLDPTDATDEVKVLLEDLEQRIGRVPNMMRAMAHSPAVLRGYVEFTAAMQRTAVPASLRNQLALAVADETGSRYLQALAEGFARRDGLDAAAIAAARRAESSDPRAAAALDFASRMVHERGRLAADDLAALREAGFGETEVVEIVALVALNLFRAYFNLALGTELDAPLPRSAR